MSKMPKRAAHFLLIPELLYSPPNTAIIHALLGAGYSVDVYAPGVLPEDTNYGIEVTTHAVSYTWMWMIRNVLDVKWFRYDLYSGTSEDPLAFVGLLAFLYGKNSFVLVDEIKSGSYRGDRSERWKSLCKSAMRRSCFQIVNDRSRVSLLRDYAELRSSDDVMVYPGCYVDRPERSISISEEIRKGWGLPASAFIIGSSGGFNMTAGADWLLDYVKDTPEAYAVIQPLGVSELGMYLLDRVHFRDRIYLEKRRLGWSEAWTSAQALDAGLCVYSNMAPQFQAMGISSNRLCMFIAMGVPVIASAQKSFRFLEDYGCGILVSDYGQFRAAASEIKRRQDEMRRNCETCFNDYIRSSDAYHELSRRIRTLTPH